MSTNPFFELECNTDTDLKEDDFYWRAGSNNFMDSGTALWDGLFSQEGCKNQSAEDDLEMGIVANDQDAKSRCNSNETEVCSSSCNPVHMQQVPPNKSESTEYSIAVAPHNFVPSITSIKESNISIESQSLPQAASDVTVHLDYTRLKAEHRKLKKYFERASESRYKSPPIQETIRRLNRHETVSLDFYRSRQEKMDLLDAALEHCDWDIVVAVLLFVKRTYSNALFRQCIIERPTAAKHYIIYLREMNDAAELIDTLFGLGHNEEATMLEFVLACNMKDPKRQLEALRNCYLNGFAQTQLATKEKRLFEEWINLLETHIASR